MKKQSSLILASFIGVVAGTAFAQAPSLPYLDPALPPAERAHDLVARMTLEEKASQMQNHADPIPRLGVPGYNWWSEALHGVMSGHTATTVFPEPIGLAASFDPQLVKRMGDVIAIEGRIRHRDALRDGATGIFEGLTFFSPNINLFRDPRWGRGQETYGEDPLLTARMGVAFIEGLQGDDPAHPKVVATAKHYAVHSGPEPLRHAFDARISAHDLEDSYLPAFRAAVVEGHVASVMCVYNAIDGVPGCANDFLLNTKLRTQWGFRGFVVSDCDAVVDISEHHHFATDTIEARAKSVRAGMDNECKLLSTDFGAPPDPKQTRAPWQDYVDAVHRGTLAESDLGQSVERAFYWRFALGMFDPPGTVKLDQLPEALADNAAHRALALQAARESMVLLRNDGVLPLKADIRRIAVVGPLADQKGVLLGNYNGTPSRSTTVLQGVRRSFPKATVSYARGSDFPGDPATVARAVLKTADGRPGLKAEYFEGAAAEGSPVYARVDAEPGVGAAEPRPVAVPAGPYTIRWSGFLTPAESGSYLLGVSGAANALWLDGKLLVDTRGASLQPPKTTTMDLVAGHRYAIDVQSFPAFDRGLQVLYSRVKTPDEMIKDAVAMAQRAQVVVAVVGITSRLEGEESAVELPGFKGGDRTSLDLPAQEQTLLEALKATGKPLIVVLMNGSALSVNWAEANANAILEAWYPGEEGGAAVGETLAGSNNPAGRLPVTFYKGVEQLPAFEDYSMANRTYRYFKGEPLYPFGFGLSYSKFAYSDLKLSAATLKAGEPLGASVQVRNTSSRDADEVVQLYVGFAATQGVPLRALRAFERVHIKAGAATLVNLKLTARELSHVDAKGQHVITPGRYTISVGGGQPATGSLSAMLEINGTAQLPQ